MLDKSDKIRVVISTPNEQFAIETDRTSYTKDIGFHSVIGGYPLEVSYLPRGAEEQHKTLPNLQEIQDIILENIMRSRYLTPNPDKTFIEKNLKLRTNYHYPYYNSTTSLVIITSYITSIKIEIWKDSHHNKDFSSN